MKTTKTINEIKQSLIEYVEWVVKGNVYHNNTYPQIADKVWKDELYPFIKNEDLQGWEKDIQKKFLKNPYVRFQMSEKQAYCLARAFQAINSETISCK